MSLASRDSGLAVVAPAAAAGAARRSAEGRSYTLQLCMTYPRALSLSRIVESRDPTRPARRRASALRWAVVVANAILRPYQCAQLLPVRAEQYWDARCDGGRCEAGDVGGWLEGVA